MSLADKVLEVNNDLPIRTDEPVHSGKVRSVYWLTKEDSARLIKERNYPVAADAALAIMVISDRISAIPLSRNPGSKILQSSAVATETADETDVLSLIHI